MDYGKVAIRAAKTVIIGFLTLENAESYMATRELLTKPEMNALYRTHAEMDASGITRLPGRVMATMAYNIGF